jgi:hypothetical protein
MFQKWQGISFKWLIKDSLHGFTFMYKYEMDRACNTHVTDERLAQSFGKKNLKEREH